jgi:hypothetical protein
MDKRNDDSWVGVLIVVLMAVCVGAVWAFSQFFGLDMATGGSVLLRLLLLTAVVFGCWKFGDEVPLIRLGNSWPLLLALFIVCWWPALDVWASRQSPHLWAEDHVVLWWNAWYTKLAVIVAGMAGYAVNLRKNDYA